MLSSCICSTLVSVCAMKGIPIRATGSVRKALDILPHLVVVFAALFLLLCLWLCMMDSVVQHLSTGLG